MENIDLWIGGLAEQTMPFGGMLGSTFNFVFEGMMEKLQSGDRFYYLQRLDGLHLFGEMENNSFSAMIMKNTDATHLPSDVFSNPGLILEIDRKKQYNPGLGETAGADLILEDDPLTTDIDESADNLGNDPTGGSLLTPLVVRDNPATPGADTNYLRYTGDEHVVLGGTEQNDILIASIGDDTLYGDGGNDRMEGGFGNDIINAGDGDDIVVDSGGDDNIKAGKGHDVVHAGPGLDLVMGNDGQDFIFLGTDMGSEVFAGTGNDFIYGNKNAERILGNEGDDWIETGTFDGAPGDNFDEIFSHDEIDGNDVFLGDGGFDEFIGEGGDDIFIGSPGRGKMVGMSGFDWANYKDNASFVNADLSIPIVFDEAPTLPQNAALDEYESVEGLSGTKFNDVLKGSNTLAEERLPFNATNPALSGTEGYQGSFLDAQGIALINGLQGVLGAGVNFFNAGDIILGGDGSDRIQGNAGDDIIDGDKWLNVRIGIMSGFNENGPTGAERTFELVNGAAQEIKSMTSPVTLRLNAAGAEVATGGTLVTKPLSAWMFEGRFNPGQLQIIREIKTDTTPLAHQVAIDMPRFGFSTAESLERGRDVDTVRSFLGGQGPVALFDLPWMPLYLVFVYFLHPMLGALTFAGAFVLTILTIITEVMTRRLSGATHQAVIARNTIADSNARNAEILKAMGMARRAVARFERANGEHLALQTRTNDISGTFGAISRVLRMILQSAILGLGAYLTIIGELSAGTIIAASVASARALAPVDLAIGNWKGVVAARTSFTRLKETMIALADSRCPDATACPASKPACGEDDGRRAGFGPGAHERRRIPAQGGPGARRHRPERRRQDHPGAGADGDLAGAARQRAPRRRGADSVEGRGSRPPHRLSAAGRISPRRDRRGEHLAL